MKVESWTFLIVGLFYLPVVLVYWAMGGEPVGLAGLGLAVLLGLMIWGYLRLTMRKLPERPEDDVHGEISAHAGEQGEFAPSSWWPLPLALCAAIIFLGLAVGWWVSLIGAFFGVFMLIGWVFEFYKGPYAH